MPRWTFLHLALQSILYTEQCWTCRVGLFYVQCRLNYSEMSGHAQNNVGHAMLDFFTAPAVFTARWSIFACPDMLDMPSWTYALCRLHNLPKMSVRTQNRVRHAVTDAFCVHCRMTIQGYDSRGVRQQGCKIAGAQDNRGVREQGCKTQGV